MAEIQATSRPRSLRAWLPAGHPLSWILLFVTFCAVLVESTDESILQTVLPAILKDFHLSVSAGGLLASINRIGLLVGCLVFGVTGDLIGGGYRRVWGWTVGMIVATVSSIATTFAHTLGLLQILRFTMGAGNGAMAPTNIALLGEWWQKEERGFAIGAHHTGYPVGQFVGPAIIGAVLVVVGWRGTWLLIPLIGVPVLIVQVVICRKSLYARVLAWIRQRGLTPAYDSVEDVTKRTYSNPFSLLGYVLRNRNVLLAIAILCGFQAGEAGAATFLTLQLTTKVGMPLAAAAVLSGASGLTGWAGQIFWGRASDRIGRRRALGIITVGWVITVLSLSLINSPTTGWILLLIWGLFRNAPYPVAFTVCVDSAPDAAASAMGLTEAMFIGVAGSIITLVSGAIVQHWGFTVNYLILAVIVACVLIPVWFLKETVTTTGRPAMASPEVAG